MCKETESLHSQVVFTCFSFQTSQPVLNRDTITCIFGCCISAVASVHQHIELKSVIVSRCVHVGVCLCVCVFVAVSASLEP